MNEKDKENPSTDKATEDEEPILLTEALPAATEDEEPILLTEEVSADSDDEEPIVLVEEVSPASQEDEPFVLAEAVSAASDQDEEAVIDLDELSGDDLTADENERKDESGIDLSASLTPEQIDKALERTIEKLYGQRIESLLIEVVQKKVSDEIEKMKKSILGD